MEIIKLQQFQNDFNSVIQKSLNQKLTIETEIRELVDYLNTIPTLKLFKKPIQSEFETIRSTRIFTIPICERKLLSDAFYSIKETGKFNDLIQTVNDTELTNQFKENTVKQAFELFEYYKWLNERLSPQKAEKKSEGLSHKEKMLALYYLGLDMRKFRNNLQSAKILSKILGVDESNTKDNLTYFDGIKCKVKTEDNLKTVLQLFEHKDFKDIHSEIKKDLEK
jgi:hypothetical protein